jgi:hypothetical protein
MSQKQIRQLIMLGVAGAAVYYLFIRSTPASAFVPGPVNVTPINPGLLPGAAQPTNVSPAPGWLTAGGPQNAGW